MFKGDRGTMTISTMTVAMFTLLVPFILSAPTTSWADNDKQTAIGILGFEPPALPSEWWTQTLDAKNAKKIMFTVSDSVQMMEYSKWAPYVWFVTYAIPSFGAKNSTIIYGYPMKRLEECANKTDFCGIDVSKIALVYHPDDTQKFHGYMVRSSLAPTRDISADAQIALMGAKTLIATEYGEKEEPMYFATAKTLRNMPAEFKLIANTKSWDVIQPAPWSPPMTGE